MYKFFSSQYALYMLSLKGSFLFFNVFVKERNVKLESQGLKGDLSYLWFNL